MSATSKRPGSNACGPLEILTIDRLSLRLDEHEFPYIGDKARALLGYLALIDRHVESRQRLTGLLWSDKPQSRAQGSLRHVLLALRAMFDDAKCPAFVDDKKLVKLMADGIKVDLWDVLAEASEGRVHPRLRDGQRFTERILADVEDIDPLFSAWLRARRKSLLDQLLHAFGVRLRAGPSAGESAREDIAAAILSLDPTHEEAARALIQLKANGGDIGGALRVYRELWDTLEEEFEVQPSEETKDLVARLRLEQSETTRDAMPDWGVTFPPATAQTAGFVTFLQPPSVSTSDRPRVMRQPATFAPPPGLVVSLAAFDAAAADPALGYLVQGFRRELFQRLLRFREWTVHDLTGPGGKLANHVAEFVVAAKASPAENGVVLTISLVESATGQMRWRDVHRLSLDTWFEAQQQVVRRVAAGLNVQLSERRLASHGMRAAKDLTAFDLWLRGQARVLSFVPEDWKAAHNLFRDVIGRAPDFAPAYSSLAQLHTTIHYAHPGVMRSAQRRAEAMHYAREAVRLDPLDSRAHLCFGWAYAMSGQFDRGTVHHTVAQDLNENDPWTLISAALNLAFCGQARQALDLSARAQLLTPHPKPIDWRYRAIVQFMAGDYEGCVASAGLADAIVPQAMGWKTAALQSLGRGDEAKSECGRFLEAVQKRWQSEQTFSVERAMRWFLHAFPIRRESDWERLRDGLSRAGAPVADVRFEQW